MSLRPCPVLRTPKQPNLTGAEVASRGNLVLAVVRDCTAALIFSLSLYFILDACSLCTWRDESPGEEGVQSFPSPTHPHKHPLPVLSSPIDPIQTPQLYLEAHT